MNFAFGWQGEIKLKKTFFVTTPARHQKKSFLAMASCLQMTFDLLVHTLDP